MISNIAIASGSATLTPDLEKYINKKVGKLDRHINKKQRESVRADVKLNESTTVKTDKKCTCEVILHVPGARLTAKESTVNMFAAIDIVEAKLQNQLRRYKEKHSRSSDKHKNREARRSLGKLFRRK